MNVKDLVRVNLLADLKTQPVAADTPIFVTGINTLRDGKGGFYIWDAASTTAEDTVYYNTVQSSVTSTGRWVRVFQRTITLPHGILNINGGVKTFYATANTVSGGTAKINLTLDNTTTGPSIFNEIWFNDSQAKTPATTAIEGVKSYIMSEDLKQTTHGFYKSQTINVLTSLLAPVIMIGAGQTVRFKVEGI